MKRVLFCELCPAAYALSVWKERIIRHIKNRSMKSTLSKSKSEREKLPFVVYQHNSLIRRKLGNVDMQLQENKAINLSIASPKINGVLIRPGETFSFWSLVGSCSASKGYREGLTISSGKAAKGTGGGMCQLTNLLHWLALHSPLEIAEKHHHDGVDLFPDYGRQVPFGCGTSIVYNYLDYRLKNSTENTFQFIVYMTETHLCGELRALHPLDCSYHILEEDRHFVRVGNDYYRRNRIVRQIVDKCTGIILNSEVIKNSNAKVMYGEEFIDKSLLHTE